MNVVSPKQVKKMLKQDEEFAILDVREEGVFSKGHQLFACCLPLSHLELKVRELVPRYGTRIILVDHGSSGQMCLAERASQHLKGFGYSNVEVTEGGIEGWRTTGFEVYTGVNVLSKAFGEFVEHTYQTPCVTAEQLKGKMERGEKLVVLDTRPKEEYLRMNIPGGINTPGAELIYRVHDLAPDPEVQIVVNCAGRTRSIIGAQSLINAGIPNTVAALKNGTMGWVLAGFELERGQTRFAPVPSETGLALARKCAERVTERFGVKRVGGATLEAWMDESESRTIYLLDVRLPDEYESGHLKGYRNAPGGQLIQATDEYVAVRNARIVLADDTHVRSTMTASWLVQMGWNDVYVLEDGIGASDLITGPYIPEVPGFEQGVPITPLELKGILDSGEQIVIIDMASSVQYRKNHIPGAWWAVRSDLVSDITRIPEVEKIVLTSPDSMIAHLASKDLETLLTGISLCVLEGGTDAWLAANLPTEKGMERSLSRVDDVWFKPYEQKGNLEQFMRDYLIWETGLLSQIERDGDAKFRAFI